MTMLAEKAAERGLPWTAHLLRRFDRPELFERPVSLDPRLGEPAHERTEQILAQMVRRGPDPILVRALLGWLTHRPLERGLFAWDVLCTSLFADHDPLLAELRAAALPLQRILPPPGSVAIDLNRHPAGQLVADFAGGLEKAMPVELMAGALEHELGALAELYRRNDPLTRKFSTTASLRAIAQVMHLAHLPTLASVYQDLCSRVLGYRPAALDLCETLFDAEAPEKIVADAIRKGDLPAALISDAAEYLVYRTWIALGDPKRAFGLFEENLAIRKLGALSPRLQVVRAHLGALTGHRLIELDRLDLHVDAEKLWRYGARARVVVSAAHLPADSLVPLERLHEFITSFGNDFRTWAEALLVAHPDAAWKPQCAPLLAREVAYLPHSPAAWKPLLMLIAPDSVTLDKARAEITARLRAQSTL